jgi:hypothetical protein
MGGSSSLSAGEAAAVRAEGRGGGGETCSQGMGISSSLTWSGAPDKQGTWGLQQDMTGLKQEGPNDTKVSGECSHSLGARNCPS